VNVELHNYNWIKNLKPFESAEQLDEFVLLFMAISGVNLSHQIDKIFWRWTPYGKFSVPSVYECQFHGSMTFFPAPIIWKAASDARSSFFAWLTMHDKILTAKNMAKRNWECHPMCSLCLCMNESTNHLLTKCNYTEATCDVVATRFDLPLYNQMKNEGGPIQWVQFLLKTGTVRQKKQNLGVLFTTFWWFVWKERNKRFF
jgi:hypothetical protein